MEQWQAEAENWLRHLWPASARFSIEVRRKRSWGENWTIDTDDGRFWFKAPHPCLAGEAGLRRVLERYAPAEVQPMHAHHAKGWIVSADAGATLSCQEGDSTPLLAQALGRIQRATPLDELLRLPLRVFRPEDSVDNLAELLGAFTTLPTNHPLRPSKQERDSACAAMAKVVARWGDVNPGLPLGIDHNDLHPGNAFAGPRIADWGDAVVAHPFSTMRVLLHHARQRSITADTYLRGWGDPAELHEAFEVAVRLAAVQRIFAWQRILNPEMAAQYVEYIRPIWLKI